jgi:hypothetical protein
VSSVRVCNPFASFCWSRALLYVALATPVTAANTYLVHNLVSDLPGVGDQQDDTLVNPWISLHSTSACRGLSILYAA